MSTDSSVYVGYADDASRHTQNSASVAWVIYTPMGQVSSLGGVCLRPSSNNIYEYSAMIELLRDSISHGIRSLEVCIDSQLVVLQLNGVYRIRSGFITKILENKVVRMEV